jgi:hypothetical protein
MLACVLGDPTWIRLGEGPAAVCSLLRILPRTHGARRGCILLHRNSRLSDVDAYEVAANHSTAW